MRVCLVTLKGQGTFEMTQSKYRLSEAQKHEDGSKLFDFCAECVANFVTSNTHEDGTGIIKPGQTLTLGFTVRSPLLFAQLYLTGRTSSHTLASECLIHHP